MDIAEQRFSWLLKQRGYNFWTEDQLEQKIKVKGRRQDFFVETPWGNLLVEVKSINKPGPIERRQSKIDTVDPKEFLGRLKKPVWHAAKQLSSYKDLNIPCLVVLDNWRQIKIPMGFVELIQLFGTFEFRGVFDPNSGSIGQIRLYHGKDRRLTNSQHTYISAVAVNESKVRFVDDEMKSERPMRLKIVHNPFAQCPMPIDIFRDSDDEHYCYKNNTWVKI